MLLGDDLLTWLVLAIGAAMAAGNLVALIRPPDRKQHEADLDRAPVLRSVAFAAVGALAAFWALASLVAG